MDLLTRVSRIAKAYGKDDWTVKDSKIGIGVILLITLALSPEVLIPGTIIGVVGWWLNSELNRGQRQKDTMNKQKRYVESLPKGTVERDMAQLRYRRMVRKARGSRVNDRDFD